MNVSCADSTPVPAFKINARLSQRLRHGSFAWIERVKGKFVLKDFRAFIAKGNVMDLAVAVIIGAAFGKIVTSLTDEIIMPIVGAIFGGADFSRYFWLLDVPADYGGSLTDYAALKEAGAALIGYGSFVTAVINFLILAFIIFLLVRYTKKVMSEFEGPEAEEVACPSEIDLLKEIRDELRAARPDYAPQNGPMG